MVAAFAAAPALSADLEDLHLNITPRTADERARIAVVTASPQDFSAPQPFEELAAGAATVRVRNDADAFSQPSGNLSFDQELDFKVGNGLFKKIWVSSPSSTLASDGLGPLFNARSCQRCHIKDGRGHTPNGPEDKAISMFLRISIPGAPEDGPAEIEGYIATLPDPNYGGQMQDFALAGHPAEYRLDIAYKEVPVELSEGENRITAPPDLSGCRSGLWAAAPQRDAEPSGRTSDDRARSA